MPSAPTRTQYPLPTGQVISYMRTHGLDAEGQLGAMVCPSTPLHVAAAVATLPTIYARGQTRTTGQPLDIPVGLRGARFDVFYFG